MREPPATRPHRCSCGRSFDAATFAALPPAAGGDVWETTEDDGTLLVLVLRNCPCGSTMAQPTLESAANIVVAIVARELGRLSLPVVEEREVLRDARETYGFDEDTTRAALAWALLTEDVVAYDSPRADAPPGTKAYRVNRKKRPF